jgi:DNA polymerase-1
MSAEKKIFFLDAYALIFRAFYAFISNPRKTSAGLNTSAIFGFVLALDDILRNENPPYIGVVFDPPTPTFRNHLYPQYKANREETPEDIRLAVPWIKKILAAFNIPAFHVDNYEADDVIGTLAKKAEQQGFQVFMMTPDKDYAQLVSPNIRMYKPKKSGNDAEIWGPEEVCNAFGISTPSQVIDILALWGDASDNVPGIPGIGEKTAAKLIAEYGSVENVLANTANFKGKQKENIENNTDLALLSKKLVTIEINVPLNFDADEFKRSDPDEEQLKALFEELEFRTLINRVLNKEGEQKPVTQPASLQGDLFSGFSSPEPRPSSFLRLNDLPKKYQTLNDVSEITTLCKTLREKSAFCFDTETTGLDSHTARLVGIALAFNDHEAFYIPASPDDPAFEQKLQPIRELLEDPRILKVGQNLKFDIRILKNYGIGTAGPLFDTMLAHYLLQPEQRHNMNLLAETYLNYSPIRIEELIGPAGKSQGDMSDVPPELIMNYACEDADVTWQLYGIFSAMLEDNQLGDLARNIEMPLVPVLADMEHEGIKLDGEILNVFANDLRNDIIGLEKRIYQLAGQEFNISSPKQLGEILFDRLKLAGDAKKTRTGQYSTNEETLLKLEGKHEIIEEVLTYRGLIKLLSTYVEALPKMINPKTGRVHTSFNQAVASTGRLSSNNPNLQNIPIREERGREIRKAFVPGSNDCVLFSADYSQIELRLMAHLSQDDNMIRAFRNGEDIHSATAARIYGIPIDQVSREMRSSAKTANFGIIYGISSFGLSQRLNIKRTDAKDLIDGYFKSFPKVKDYMDHSIRIAREKSCVYTLFNRKRYLPDIHSKNSVVRGMAERNAINAPIQGSAADIIKIAMIKIWNRMSAENLKSRMLLQVHDELLFEARLSELEKLKTLVIEEMEHAVELSVPLTVETGFGKNWLEAH